MIAPDLTYKAGDVLVFQTGEYSDLHFHGPFIASRGFSRSEVVSLFMNQRRKPKDAWDQPDGHEFIMWLNREGYIEDQPATFWHVGSYGEFTP